MKKKFDCVAFQDQQAKRISEETAHMTRSVELAYWAKKLERIVLKPAKAQQKVSAVREAMARYNTTAERGRNESPRGG